MPIGASLYLSFFDGRYVRGNFIGLGNYREALASADFGQKPVCSGPYKFVERVQNDRIVLEKFADHWDAKNYNFERIVFQPIPDTTVRLANLRSGDLDMIERLAPTDAASVKEDSTLTYADAIGTGYMALYANIGNGARAAGRGRYPRSRS